MRLDDAWFADLDGGHSPQSFNIRLQRLGRHAQPATRDEIIEVLEIMARTGTVPPGWRFMWVNWALRASVRGTGWSGPGTIDDFANCAPAIRAALQAARVALVRQGG